jgi:RNA polymerase sigma-70 factor (ECF subfamily)
MERLHDPGDFTRLDGGSCTTARNFALAPGFVPESMEAALTFPPIRMSAPRPIPATETAEGDEVDVALMGRIADGDEHAFRELVERHQHAVVGTVARMLGDPTEAEDIAQLAFLRVWKHAKRWRPDAKFTTYLFTIAANLVRNHARWRQRHPSVSIEAGEETGHEAADQAPSPDESAASHDKLRAIQVAMAALPPELREAMTLFTHEDLGYAEIATIAGCSPKAVETRIYRARQLLKEALKDLER